MSPNAANVDDTASTGLLQQRQGIACESYGGTHIDIGNPLPVFLGTVFKQVLIQIHSRIIYDNIHATKGVYGFIKKSRSIKLRGEVCRYR
eukprot:CAMPEP_0174974922 /NCGR_PEP_ID=MMETSP0004_2-20121128/12137_1 /TAXON_ID=420556 /ORGANISM="Ochromonas sp., Strain CCMP1393" /LENGTH=89 /DNA_ID=CAMNT_0016225677 /DNA_START=612 /DNA_END=881 /DNA_ORIENTATION=+